MMKITMSYPMLLRKLNMMKNEGAKKYSHLSYLLKPITTDSTTTYANKIHFQLGNLPILTRVSRIWGVSNPSAPRTPDVCPFIFTPPPILYVTEYLAPPEHHLGSCEGKRLSLSHTLIQQVTNVPIISP